MKRSKSFLTKKAAQYRYALTGSVLALTILVFLVTRLLPATENDIRRSTCHIDGYSRLSLVTGQDTVVLRTDTIHQQGTWVNRHWWWPGCSGRILTIARGDMPARHRHRNEPAHWFAQMTELTDSIGRLLKRKESERKELAYYLRSHGVQDEGYMKIAGYAELQSKETDELKKTHAMLRAYKPEVKPLFVRKYSLRASWYDKDGKMRHEPCFPRTMACTGSNVPMMLQTVSKSKPWDCYAVRIMPWKTSVPEDIVTVTLSSKDGIFPQHALLAGGRCRADKRHDLPTLFAPMGSPAFSRHGYFMGIVSDGKIEPPK